MPDELKPCPFCGGTDLGIGRLSEDREGYPTYVYCGECGAHGPWVYTRETSMLTCTKIACEATGWNTRKCECKTNGEKCQTSN